jgi:cardiolipin synthase
MKITREILLSIPNLLSALRIFLIPLFLYLVFLRTPVAMFWGLAVFCIASLTDLIDGWSARMLNQESDLGRFLDPLADKFLVISAFIALLFLDPLIPFWMVLVIVGRDLLITLMRYLSLKKGATLRTSRFGKVKTAFQMVSIVIIIMVFIVQRSGHVWGHSFPVDVPLKFKSVTEYLMSNDPYRYLITGPYILMALVTLLTALSGVRYLFTNWRVLMPPYKSEEDR